ncbi:hypothetical protein HAX54_007194, partial [Datura stramonium]|nr:hypothetical protein [Datura stramonium]
ESMKVMQESHSCMISSICRMRPLLQEQMQLDFTALDAAKTEDATMEEATNGASKVFGSLTDSMTFLDAPDTSDATVIICAPESDLANGKSDKDEVLINVLNWLNLEF